MNTRAAVSGNRIRVGMFVAGAGSSAAGLPGVSPEAMRSVTGISQGDDALVALR